MVTAEEFEVAVKRIAKGCQARCLRVLGNREDAEDAVQQGFMMAWRKRDQFRGESSLGTWISVIVSHEMITHLRRTKGERAALVHGHDYDPVIEESQVERLIEEQLIARIRCSRILTDQERQAVNLGLADHGGAPKVRLQRHRAIHKLRNLALRQAR